MNVPTKSWMREDTKENVSGLLTAGQRAEHIKQMKIRYKLYADLLAGKSADITVDPQVFAYVNRERLALEEYMNFFPEQVRDALQAAEDRRQVDTRDYNPKSQAKHRYWGPVPTCVANLFAEIYQNSNDRFDAYKRFFNEFPRFRISEKKI